MNKLLRPRCVLKLTLFLYRLPKTAFYFLFRLFSLPKFAFFLLLSLCPLTGFATSYWVTQYGGGHRSGTSLANPWSIADFNGSSKPTGGDTVTFNGTFTSTVTPAKGGTGNGGGRLTLNFAAATLTSAATRIQLNGLSYLTLIGGSLASAYSGLLINFNPNSGG